MKKTITLAALAALNLSTCTIKDDSPRGCKTINAADVRPGDMVVLDNHFTEVVEDAPEHKQFSEERGDFYDLMSGKWISREEIRGITWDALEASITAKNAIGQIFSALGGREFCWEYRRNLDEVYAPVCSKSAADFIRLYTSWECFIADIPANDNAPAEEQPESEQTAPAQNCLGRQKHDL